MPTSREHYDERTFLIFIDSYENNVPTGCYYSPYHEETDAFQSLSQLLLKLDQSLDVENIPQSFQNLRTFFPKAGIWPSVSQEISLGRGRLATFVVRVYFRRNVSWQGRVTWLDEERTQNFRSVLELICLMDSALSESCGPKWYTSEQSSNKAAMI